MKRDEIIKRLREFNSIAKELFSLSFIDKSKDSGCSIHWDMQNQGISTELRGPDDEAIKACCNDLRKFIQKNDSLRIEKLIPVYTSPLIEVAERDDFNTSIGWYYDFKERPASMKITINEKRLTNKDIFEAFLYGKFSHRSKGTKDIHDAWEKQEPLYTLLKNEFIVILHGYLQNIQNFVIVNNRVLEKLSQKND